MKTSNDKRRRSITWCSQHKCIHGAEFQYLITGKYFCQHCVKLLDKSQVIRLNDIAQGKLS